MCSSTLRLNVCTCSESTPSPQPLAPTMPISVLAFLLLLLAPNAAAGGIDGDGGGGSISVELTAANHLPQPLTLPSPPSTLSLPLGHHCPSSPGARPGSITTCTRILTPSLPRLRHLRLFSHALKLRLNVSAPSRQSPLDLCLHRNASLGPGMCAADKWETLGRSEWVKALSPFEETVLDVRMVPDPSRVVEVSAEHEFLLHRLVFLVVGVVMMATAHVVSRSLVFYYGSAMIAGVILVALMVLFQGMKLLPTGRKSSLVLFMYSSVVGVATFLLSYLSGVVRSVLVELGISEDMHNPLGIFLLMCLVLAGAWFGFWSVRKLVLTDDGVVESSVAFFVECSIFIFAAVMILLSSLDPLLAGEALCCAIVIMLIARTNRKTRFMRSLFKQTINCTTELLDQISPSKISYSGGSQHSKTHEYRSPNLDLNKTWPRSSSRQESFYSTFHRTPDRKTFSKEEWESVIKEQTRESLKQLISSPDFNQWAVKNADRIMVTPRKHSSRDDQRRRFWWF